MQFAEEAPGLLHPDGSGGWIAYWDATGGIDADVSAALNDPMGWGRADITFVQSSAATPRVVFSPRASFPPGTGGGTTLGTTYWSTYDGAVMSVELLSSYVTDHQNTNHEAGHAFFWMQHSASTDSIMFWNESESAPVPTTSDIAYLEAWLGDAESSSIQWFPGGLETYITRWPVPAGCQSRLTVSVIREAFVTLQPVYAASYTDMLAGDYERFAPGVECFNRGFFVSRWRDAPVGENYVGIVAKVDSPSDLSDLVVGLAEVQIR